MYRRLQTDWGNVSCIREHLRHRFESSRSDSNLVYVFAGYGNAGDHVSHLGVRRLIGLPGPARLFGARVCDGLPSRSSHLVIGGGGLFQPVFEPAWRSVLESKCSFSIFGVGLAETPPQRPAFSRDLLRAIASHCSFAMLRDEMTAAAYRSVGGDCEVGFCPSLIELRERKRPVDESCSLLLHVVHPSDLRLAGHRIDAVRSAVERLAKSRSLEYLEIDHCCSYSSKVVDLYDQAALCVSSRLHGCLMAYARGVECLPLVCDRKTSAFYETHTGFLTHGSFEDFLLCPDDDIPSCAGASSKQVDDIVDGLNQIAGRQRERLAELAVA